MGSGVNKKKASAIAAQAQLLLGQGEFAKIVTLIEAVVPPARDATLWGLLSEAHRQLGHGPQARAALDLGLKADPSDPALQGTLGALLVREGNVEEGLRWLEKARSALSAHPGFLVQYAYALARAGRLADAESFATRAMKKGAGDEGKLVLALLKAKHGEFADAAALCGSVMASSAGTPLFASAKAMWADCQLFLGDTAKAYAALLELNQQGTLEPSYLAHLAYAAELQKDQTTADEIIIARTQASPSAEEHLLFAQVMNLRNRPGSALMHLEALATASGERFAGFEYEALATWGRTYRLMGMSENARQALALAAAMPEHRTERLGARVRVDLGHLKAETGDFEAADELFREALTLDPGDPEAKQALEHNKGRVAWRDAVRASAGAQVEAARAESEALRRRFVSREGELEKLQDELARMRKAQADAEARARKAEADAASVKARSDAEQKRRLTEELEARERDVVAKATEALTTAFAGVSCPPALMNVLLVAEKTFQKAFYTELPTAAVAVLYAGALERALFSLFVEQFDGWLERNKLRESFLEGAVRERRGSRIEYWDFFVEAFDQRSAGMAPAMGEIARVLSRRHESYLVPFARFLKESFSVEDGFFDALVEFVTWSKERLRDPLAHGRGIDLKHEELKDFRERLLLKFAGAPQGALPQLLRPKA